MKFRQRMRTQMSFQENDFQISKFFAITENDPKNTYTKFWKFLTHNFSPSNVLKTL